ncbi:MAG TPA: 2-C-methyl-D-erythritol 4-phosphate cytidylyltransferase, partial [Paludibacteraceae bacterium]|nr:2-C-methyl-D-erythritol 4-phosphate cytidylyltransferase [Paludibacteraceae bacterium]
CQQHHFDIPHQIVGGGETRFHSVKKGIEAISYQLQKNKKITNKKNVILVAIHDGVRPFVSTDTIDRCFEEAEKEGNAIPAVELTDSIRKVSLLGNEAEERRNYRLIQTPQVFKFSLLQKAYQQQYSPFFTDDASVVEAMGVNIHLVEGNCENIKLTTSFDLELAEFLLSRNESINK